MNYTENMSQALAFGAGAAPQVLTATPTLHSDKIDLTKGRRALFLFRTGTFGGTSPTLSAVLNIDVSADGTTWVASTVVSGNPTVTAGGKTAELEIRADQATQQNNTYKYARMTAVCTIGGTSPTIPVDILSIGGCGVQAPNSANNDASVVSITTAA